LASAATAAEGPTFSSLGLAPPKIDWNWLVSATSFSGSVLVRGFRFNFRRSEAKNGKNFNRGSLHLEA